MSPQTDRKRSARKARGPRWRPSSKGQMHASVGHKTVTLVGTRLRLPKKFFDVLRNLKVTELWVAPLPGAEALVLCPPVSWPDYGAFVRDATRGDLAAKRVFIYGAELKRVDTEGRITLDVDLLEGIGSKAGGRVVVVGVGLWLELWGKESGMRCAKPAGAWSRHLRPALRQGPRE